MYKEESNKKTLFEEKIFYPVIKDFLSELGTAGEIKSSIDFLYKYKRSYVQISNHKKLLIEKGVIDVMRDGNTERMVPTKLGKELAAKFKELITVCKKIDEVGK